MQNLLEVLKNSSTGDTLQRRQRMAQTIRDAIASDPHAFDDLLATILYTYQKGTIPHFWDLLAVISGNQRGFGNDWLYTALELRKQTGGAQ